MFEDLLDGIIKETERQLEETVGRTTDQEWNTGEEDPTWYAIPDEVWRA